MADEMIQTQDMGGRSNVVLPPQNLDERTIRWMESSDDLLLLLEHDLKGEYMVVEEMEDGRISEKWVRDPDNTTPQLNDLGIRFVIGTLRLIANKNTYLSYFKSEGDSAEKRIMDICKYTSVAYTNNIFLNINRFGIKDTTAADLIVEKMNNVMETAMRRAIGGKERLAITGAMRTVETISQQPKQQGGGLGGIFGGH